MSSKVKIALVEYLNTLPFEWAIQILSQYLPIELIKTVPAECAALLKEGKADLALIPIGAIDEIDDAEIVLDFCIACDGAVRTVCIFSNQPLTKVNTIFLDQHSRTSHLLAKVLMIEYFDNKDVEYIVADVESIDHLEENEGVLMIGDKVFKKENVFKHKTDLGQVWKDLTGLPFVFAVWTQRKSNQVSESVLKKINDAFFSQITKLDSGECKEKLRNKYKINLESYFRINIAYNFAKAKKMSILLFKEKVKSHNLTRS